MPHQANTIVQVPTMIRITTLIVLAALTLVGCSDDDDGGNGPSGNTAYVRLLHMNFDGDALDLRVDASIVKQGVTFGKSSGYGATTPGRFDVSVHRAGESDALKSSSQALNENGYHSVYAFPPTNAFSAGFSTDRIVSNAGTASVKFVNASYNKDDINEKYDLYVTGSSTAMFSDVRRLTNTGYFSLAAGRYSFTLRRTDDDEYVQIYKEVDLLNQSSYTLVLHGTPDESDGYEFGIQMFTDNEQGTDNVEFEKAANVGDMMFLMAIHGSEAVDVAVDGAIPQVTNLPYKINTDYLTFSAGAHTYGVAASSQAYLIDQPITLNVGQKYTVVLTGTKNPRDIVPLHLKDETVPDPSSALVRFIHLSPDANEVSVIAKDALGPGSDLPLPGMQDIQYREVSESASNPGSNFLKFTVPGVYTLAFRDVVEDSVVKTVKNIEFKAGKIYTLWYGGLQSNNNLNAYTLVHN